MTQPEQLVTQVSEETSQICPSWHVSSPGWQRSLPSSQLSTPVQATPSSQLRGVPLHVPPEQMSLTVQNRSSSQSAPSLSDHESVEAETSQT